MLRFLLMVVDLFLWLPWWGAVGVLVGLAAGMWLLARHFMQRLERELITAVAEEGKPLAEALVNVHAIEPAAAPLEPSPLDLDSDDENYDPDLDGAIPTDEAADYFWVDATIAPRDLETSWDPSLLTLVAGDFEPAEELDFCEEMALLHTLEVWRDGQFVMRGEGSVSGPQRLRMLFAVPRGMREMKFSYHFTCFGRLLLPEGVEALEPQTV